MLAPPGVALAADAMLEVASPPGAAIGDRVSIAARITVDGSPVPGAVLVLSHEEQFIGERGYVEIDRQVTGPDGIAVFRFVERDPDGDPMRVTYDGPDPEIVAAPVDFQFPVEPGPQQYRSRAGVDIPWLSGWVLVALVVIVWGTIAVAAFQLVRIARFGATGASAPKSEGSSTLATVITVVVVTLGSVIVAVLIRSPQTHANLGSAEGYTRTPVAYVDQPVDYLGPGLDESVVPQASDDVAKGRALFFAKGCAGCHTFDASGGIVGPKLRARNVDDLLRDVRRGPGGMPAYEETALTDDEVGFIASYLRAVRKGGSSGG